MQIHRNRRPLQKAFSLVEMLIVAAVIGVLTQISLSAVRGVIDRADRETAKANARNIANLGNAALAAGEPVYDGVTRLGAAVRNVLGGIQLTSLGNGSASFEIGELSRDEKRYARKFLRFRDGRLVYIVEGKGAFEEQQDEAEEP